MSQHVALFGPTGYIGTKMVIDLYNTGVKLSLFSRSTRNLDYLQDECFLFLHKNPNICIVKQFIKEQYFDDMVESLRGVDVAYYLIHSLNVSKDDFLNTDNALAELVARACEKAGVKQIIYLGGLGVDTAKAPLSKHLLSRQETAEHLRMHHHCVTEFRAGVIIGAGSVSFEIIRSLGTKLPFMPKLSIKEGLCQPIFVDDVISYLLHAKMNPNYFNQIAEIGSKDVLSYTQMIQQFREVIVGNKILMVRVPLLDKILTPTVLSYIIAHLTHMPQILIKRLLEGMSSFAIVGEHSVEKIDADCPVHPLDYIESIKEATKRSEDAMYQSIWNTPYELSVLNAENKKQFLYLTSKEKEGMLYEEFSQIIPIEDMDRVFENIKNIGGKTGYYSPRWLWQVRGLIDKLLGGSGLIPNKRNPKLLRVGDRIDFWAVTYYRNWKYTKVLRLKATMKSPGDAWLQFSITTSKDKTSAVLTLKAYFEPSGVWGYIYWYSLYFIHKYIFKEMVQNIINTKS